MKRTILEFIAASFCALMLCALFGAGAPNYQGAGGVTVSTGLSDSANLARLNAANVFTNNNTVGGGSNKLIIQSDFFGLRASSVGTTPDIGFSSTGSFRDGGGIRTIGAAHLQFSSDYSNADTDLDLRDLTPRSIIGTTTNNSAAMLSVGEYIQSLIAIGAPISLTNNTAANVTFISLSSGDWDVEGNLNLSGTGVTQTAAQGGTSSTSATLPTDGSECYSGVVTTALNEVDTITMPRKRFSIAATTPHTGLTGVAATNVITDTAHGYSDTQPIYFTAIAGGAGLVISTVYYVRDSTTDTYTLAATSGGAAIDFTTAITSGTVTAATNVYLIAKSTFSLGSVGAFGAITARRVR